MSPTNTERKVTDRSVASTLRHYH